MNKIYEGELTKIYLKGKKMYEIGYEAAAAIDVLVGALVGAKTFALHLSDEGKKEFWNDFKNDAIEFINKTEELILHEKI